MRRITYVLSLVLVFMLPWEDSAPALGLGSLIRVMGFVVAAFWFSTVLVEGRFRRPHLFHFLVLLFFLWNVMSAFWSWDIGETLQRASTYGQMLLLMLVFWEMFQAASDLMAGLQAYVLGAYVLVVDTIYNYINGIVAVAYEGRYSATGVNAVDLALMLMLGLPVALHLFLVGGKGTKRAILGLINLAYIPSAIFAVALTGSRTSLLAIVPFGLFIAASPQIRLQRKALLFVVLLFALLTLAPFVPQSVVGRLGTIGTSIEEGDIGGRVELWRESIALLAEHPVLGIGSGTLASSIGSAAHETYISVAAETGFVGLALFLSILAVVVYQALRLPKRACGLWLAVFMTWAIGVLSLSWEFRKPTWLFFSFVVIEGGLTTQLRAEKATVPVSGGTKQPVEMHEAEISTTGAR